MQRNERLRAVNLAALLSAAAGGGGCQSYQARPIELAAHREAFFARTPASPEVAEYARSLAAASGDETAVFDPTDGLTVAEGEVVAIVFNRDLRLARLRAGVSAASAEFAGLWEDPVLGTDLVHILESTEHPWKVFASVGFTIPLSGRLEIEKRRAAAESRTDLMRAWAQEWTTRAELKRTWVEWSAARERAGVLKSLLDRTDQIVAIVDRIAEAGEMTRVEVRLFRIERATRAAELAAIEAEVWRGELAIRSLLGLSPTAMVVLAPAITLGDEHDAPSAASIEPTDASVGLAVARAEYAVAESTLELEIRKQYPDLTIGPGYGREDGQDQFLLGLSIPLPFLNRNQQGIAAASAVRELARASYEAEYERLASELAHAANRVHAASLQRRIFERDVVPLVDEQYADARRIAELGEVDTLVLLETLIRQQEAKSMLIESRAAESLARIRLEELIGPPAEPPTPTPTTQERGVKP